MDFTIQTPTALFHLFLDSLAWNEKTRNYLITSKVWCLSSFFSTHWIQSPNGERFYWSSPLHPVWEVWDYIMMRYPANETVNMIMIISRQYILAWLLVAVRAPRKWGWRWNELKKFASLCRRGSPLPLCAHETIRSTHK